MLDVAIVGAGVMGSNHARVALANPGTNVAHIIDPDLERATALAEHVGAQAWASIDALPELPDAAVVATPSHLHRETAEKLAAQGVHVLVEKPLALSVEDAMAMCTAADAGGVVLSVGHVERFNPAILELDRLVEEPIHIGASRVSPFSPRVRESIVLDMMIHDLDIVAALVRSELDDVAAISHSHRSETHDLVNALLRFRNGVTAAVAASRIGQHKERQIVITQPESVITVDLLRQDITISKMHHAEYTSDSGTRYRQSGVVEIPFLEHRGEPLALEHADFYGAIREGRPPRVTGADGVNAVRMALQVIEAADCV
jgi:predicted dehydrogenase